MKIHLMRRLASNKYDCGKIITQLSSYALDPKDATCKTCIELYKSDTKLEHKYSLKKGIKKCHTKM